MAKKILFSALLMSLIPMMSRAQADTNEKPILFPKLFGLNNRVSVGLLGGGMNKLNDGLIGLNASVYGVYIDFMGWPHKNTGETNINLENVNIEIQQHRSILTSHIGYQIPFYKYQDGSIRLIPVVGLALTSINSKSKSVMDGSTSEYKTTVTNTEFDYGGVLVFQNKDNHIGDFNFSIGITRYTIWLGLGIDIPVPSKN